MVTITAVPATEAGALPGFRCECPCGLSWSVSLPGIARSEAQAHADWHARMGRWPVAS